MITREAVKDWLEFHHGAEIQEIRFPAGMVELHLKDGRIISFPREWFPRLNEATDEELQNYEVVRGSIHWPILDEDINIGHILLGSRSGETEQSLQEWRARMKRIRSKNS